jgi:hypothetical protein
MDTWRRGKSHHLSMHFSIGLGANSEWWDNDHVSTNDCFHEKLHVSKKDFHGAINGKTSISKKDFPFKKFLRWPEGRPFVVKSDGFDFIPSHGKIKVSLHGATTFARRWVQAITGVGTHGQGQGQASLCRVFIMYTVKFPQTNSSISRKRKILTRTGIGT